MPLGCLPAPAPLTSTALLHAQPRAAPRASPASCPASARARPLGAAWPDPAPPPRRPPPGSPRPTGVGGAARGRGPRGVPPPGRGHTQAPRVTRVRSEPAGAVQSDSVFLPPRPRGCVSGALVNSGLAVAATASYPQPQLRPRGPAAAGHCSSTKGQAPQRPPCPLRSSSRSLSAPDTLSDFGVQRGRLRVSCHPLSLVAQALHPSTREGAQALSVPAPPPAARWLHTWICRGGAIWWRIRKT